MEKESHGRLEHSDNKLNLAPDSLQNNKVGSEIRFGALGFQVILKCACSMDMQLWDVTRWNLPSSFALEMKDLGRSFSYSRKGMNLPKKNFIALTLGKREFCRTLILKGRYNEPKNLIKLAAK